MRRFSCILLAVLALAYATAQPQGGGAFDIDDFHENPFAARDFFPDTFASSAELERYYRGSFVPAGRTELANKYTAGQTDVRVRLDGDGISLWYYCIGGTGTCYLELATLEPGRTDKLKYPFAAGMLEPDIIRICGSQFHKNQHERNYELCFQDPMGLASVHFLFNNRTRRLTSIDLWYYIE